MRALTAGTGGVLPSLDLERLEALAAGGPEVFAAARPFPHLVIDDFLRPAVAAAMAGEFDPTTAGWVFLHHVNERKLILPDLTHMGPASRAVVADLQTPSFVAVLERLTGVTGLLADPTLDGGGLAVTAPGGYLNVHSDSLAHGKRRTWSRQVNLILFLTPGWQEAYRGWLELWDAPPTRCVRRILPSFNRAVLFRTTPTSLHGVPAGVASPPGVLRQSLAVYYFRDEGRVCRLHPTRYLPLPGDPPLRRALIHLDRFLLTIYAYVKRYTPIGDTLVSRLLRRF